MIPFDLSPPAALWMGLAILGAAFVRGYSGFGFAALIVAAAGLVTNPLHFVPVVLLADILLTAQQARDIRRHVAWRRVATLFAGCLVGVPLGVWALTRTDPDTARAAISLYILAMCALLLTGWTMRRPAGDGAHVATGVISGIANGAAVGGLPVAAFFAAQPIAAATFRATLIAYFTLLDLWTIPLLWAQGLITRDTLLATALGLPLMMLGVHLGSRRFLSAAPDNFRRFAILLLALLATLGLVRSLA
jgi:uncharacterized membrane protein YfcA